MPELCSFLKQRKKLGLCLYPGSWFNCSGHYRCIDLDAEDEKKQESNYLRIQILNEYIMRNIEDTEATVHISRNN